MCIKKVKLINHDCLPILMLLYILLYTMHAYIMLLAALSNAVCLHNAFSKFAIDFCKCFLFQYLSWFILILCSHDFLYERAMCSLEKYHLKITIIIIIIKMPTLICSKVTQVHN